MQFSRHIPNALTLCNLMCGVAGIIAFIGNGPWFEGFTILSFFLAASLVFDFLDGFTARLLKVHSPLGKQLDSLADVISFGAVPGILMFFLLQESVKPHAGQLPDSIAFLIPFAGLLISAFSALRLGIFNLDETQGHGFRGLPTPANTLFIWGLFANHQLGIPEGLHAILFHPLTLLLVTGASCAIMVSRMPLLAFKFSSWGWKENRFRYLFFAGTGLLILLFRLHSIPLVILLYILASRISGEGKTDRKA